jgi:mRNA interferase RelE/StbE
MAYRVFLRPAAVRDLESLEPKTKARIEKAITMLGDNSRPPGARKLVGFESEWRLRVGNYRVLYSIDDAAGCVTIARVAHRREAYR